MKNWKRLVLRNQLTRLAPVNNRGQVIPMAARQPLPEIPWIKFIRHQTELSPYVRVGIRHGTTIDIGIGLANQIDLVVVLGLVVVTTDWRLGFDLTDPKQQPFVLVRASSLTLERAAPTA